MNDHLPELAELQTMTSEQLADVRLRATDALASIVMQQTDYKYGVECGDRVLDADWERRIHHARRIHERVLANVRNLSRTSNMERPLFAALHAAVQRVLEVEGDENDYDTAYDEMEAAFHAIPRGIMEKVGS